MVPWIRWVLVAFLLVACSEPTYENVDLAPTTRTEETVAISTISTGTVARMVGDLPLPIDVPTSSTTPPNPADLGRVEEPDVLYVGPNGDDQSDGLLPSRAFRTLNYAVSVLEAGDQLLVLEGDYDEEFRSDTAVYVTAKGAPEAWIHIVAYPGHDVIVRGSERNAFKLEGAEYLEISGLELIGSGTDRLGAGIHVENPSHHIVIQRLSVHGFPAGGINVTGSSHITIADNEVFDNARFNPGQHSGISFWRPENLGFDDVDGYSNYVVGNTVYRNENTVPGDLGITDGNCVILDQSSLTGFTGRTLIANNLCFDNGGRGVNIHESAHADVVNNTLYHNLTTRELAGENAELMAYDSTDARFVNNLVIPSDGNKAGRSSRTNDVIFTDNLFVGDDSIGGENTFIDRTYIEDVVFAPGIDPASNNFSLIPDGVAVDLGRDDFSQILTIDKDGNRRLAGLAVDVGAFEVQE